MVTKEEKIIKGLSTPEYVPSDNSVILPNYSVVAGAENVSARVQSLTSGGAISGTTGTLKSVTLTPTDATKAITVNQGYAANGMEMTNTSTQEGIRLTNSGILATNKAALDVRTSGAAQTTGLAAFYLDNSNASSSIPAASIIQGGSGNSVVITNGGTGYGLFVDQNGNNNALNVDAENTTTDAVVIAEGAVTTGRALNVYSNNAGHITNELVKLTVDHASASAKALTIQQDGTGNGIFIDQNNTGNAIEIDKDVASSAAVEYGMKIASDVAAGGGSGAGIDLSSFSAGEITINFPAGNASSKNPETDAEEGWINIAINGTVKYIPYYAA